MINHSEKEKHLIYISSLQVLGWSASAPGIEGKGKREDKKCPFRITIHRQTKFGAKTRHKGGI